MSELIMVPADEVDDALASPAGGSAVAVDGAAAGPRRILFVDHTALLGGGEIALLNLVRHLDPGRYEPVVLLFSDGPLREKLDEAGVETHVLPARASVVNARKDGLGGRSLLRLRDVAAALAFVWRVRRFVRGAGVDLVHTNSLKADVIGGLAGRLAGKPVLWHVRDRIADDYLPRPVVRAFRLLARCVPHLVVANSNATLRTLWPTSPGRGEAIPSGIALADGGRRPPTPERLRVVHDGMARPAAAVNLAADLPVTGDAAGDPTGAARLPVVGIVGRISPWKGQHVFLRAAARVRQQFPGARFQVIGAALFDEQAYEREVRALAGELGLTESVEFTGFRRDVPDLIAGLDVLVHASTSGEPFGQVVIEGMAAGKPVVATDGGGVPEIVVDGVTGLLVPMGDEGAMAAAVSYLLANPGIGREMGRLGRERVYEQFTIEQTADKVQALYQQMLDDPARPAPADDGGGGGRAATGAAPAGAGAGAGRIPAAAATKPSFLVRAARGGPLLAAVGAALAVQVVLRRGAGWSAAEHPYAPVFPLLAAVAAAAAWYGWAGGLAAAALGLAGDALLTHGFDARAAWADAAGPRAVLFLGAAAGMVVVIELLHRQSRAAQAARDAAEADGRRATFLAKAATTLAASGDVRSLVAKLGYLACEGLADWCIIDLVDPAGRPYRAAVVHRSPATYELTAELCRFAPAEDRILAVVTGGAGAATGSPPARPLAAGVSDPRHRRLLGGLGCCSYVVVPLSADRLVLGAITFVAARHHFDRRDIALAQELGWRAGLALAAACRCGLERAAAKTSQSGSLGRTAI